MIKSSVGGQGRNRGKSTRKLKGETIRRERQLRTDRSHLIKIRNCLFEEDGSDKDTLAPFEALTSFKKNNLVANIEFTTGAYLDKLDISTLKRIRKHAAPRASFFGTSFFGAEDARFLIVRGVKQEETEEKEAQEPVVSAQPTTTTKSDDQQAPEQDDVENIDPDGPLREDEVGEFTEQEMKEIEETFKELNVNVDKNENAGEREEDDDDEDDDEEDEPDYPVIAYVRFFFTLQGELIDRNTGQPCLMIQDLFVEPAFQHCGLGKHLVQLCELMSRSLTLPMMYIVSTKSMEENLRGFLENKLKGYVDDDGSDFLDRPMSVMLPHLVAFVKRF